MIQIVESEYEMQNSCNKLIQNWTFGVLTPNQTHIKTVTLSILIQKTILF